MANLPDVKEVAKIFSKHLASAEVNDKAVLALAEEVVTVDSAPIALDICQYGICVDYRIPRRGLGELINRFEDLRNVGKIEIFPEGIINPDYFRVRAEHIGKR